MTPKKREDCSRLRNNVGVDSLKSTLETEDNVLRAEHIDPIDVTSSAMFYT